MHDDSILHQMRTRYDGAPRAGKPSITNKSPAGGSRMGVPLVFVYGSIGKLAVVTNRYSPSSPPNPGADTSGVGNSISSIAGMLLAEDTKLALL